MATNFPASLDALTNPTSSDSLSSPSHSAQHANVNDAVEALQAKVGADSSAVTSSLDYKVAQLEALGSIQTYTPTWTAAGGTPTIGNGSLTGKYTVINNWCVGSIFLETGSTTSISGTSEWRFSLPVSPANTAQFQAFGAALAIDAGTAGYRGTVLYFLTDKVGVYASDAAGTVGSIVPFTWTVANADKLAIDFSYEVA